VVSAASSLANVLEDLAARHERAAGDVVALNFAASNTLARQIAAGAPVDVFVSADEAQMDAVARYLVPGTRVDLLSNVLAVAVPSDRPRRLTSIAGLDAPEVRRIAVGDPVAVPVGVYARRYLERVGLWARLEPRLVPTASARLALAAVENGVVDAAIVYRTDIAAAARAVEAFVVPAGEGPRIVYAAARVRDGDAPEAAARFMAFLQSAEAAAVFEAAGFVPLATPR
jgi:molybdate transport system substrate-binding protein